MRTIKENLRNLYYINEKGKETYLFTAFFLNVMLNVAKCLLKKKKKMNNFY